MIRFCQTVSRTSPEPYKSAISASAASAFGVICPTGCRAPMIVQSLLLLRKTPTWECGNVLRGIDQLRGIVRCALSVIAK
jgi:hypothetical protein